MKVFVTAPKSFIDYERLNAELGRYDVTEIISTGETPARAMWEKWAGRNNVPLLRVEKPSRSRAGARSRDKTITKMADVFVVFHKLGAKSTGRTIDDGLLAGKPVDVVFI